MRLGHQHGLNPKYFKKMVISHLEVEWATERSKQKSMNIVKEIAFVLRVCDGWSFRVGQPLPYGSWSPGGVKHEWVGLGKEGPLDFV